MWPVGGADDRHLSLAVNTCQVEDLRVQEINISFFCSVIATKLLPDLEMGVASCILGVA